MIAPAEQRRNLRLRQGTYVRVARRFKNKRTGKPMTGEHVRQVWLGNRPGERILAALWREYQKQQPDDARLAAHAQSAA